MQEEKDIWEAPPQLREFVKFLTALNAESDRGAVLIAAAMLDDEETKRLLEGFNAPLGTLSARILGAFALGILSEREYRECERIRKIRNVFAHNVHASFGEQKLRDLCANLEGSAKDYDDVQVDAKGQFTTAAVGLISSLTNRAHYVGQRRLEYGNWSP